jgi:hypothetical protein
MSGPRSAHPKGVLDRPSPLATTLVIRRPSGVPMAESDTAEAQVPGRVRKGASRRTRPVEIPAPGRTPYEASPGTSPPGSLGGLACEVGALGVQPGRFTESLAGATTADYAHPEALCSREKRPHRREGKNFAAVTAPDVRDHEHGSCWIAAIVASSNASPSPA